MKFMNLPKNPTWPPHMTEGDAFILHALFFLKKCMGLMCTTRSGQ